MSTAGKNTRIGVFDHTGASLGGGTLVAAHLASLLSKDYTVDLIRDWSGFSRDQVSNAFSLNLDEVNVRNCEAIWDSFDVPGRFSLARQLRRSRALTAEYDLFICAGHWVPPFCKARHGLIYCHFPIGFPGTRELESDGRWANRTRFDRWMRIQGYQLEWRARMNGYDRFLSNSSFTASWMKRRWGVRAEVLYPPVELDVPQVEKQNRIISIGRFFGKEPRSKGHRAQIEAFREFLARVPESWELWMIGSSLSDEDRAYLLSLEGAAGSLPVRFLVNVDRRAILEALAGAKLFWHTAGLSENKDEDPAFAEHFGMATVEAMRAGCVPVVVNSGGQSEIIENAVSGFLCRDIAELIGNTVTVTENSPLCSSMAAEARRRSMDFSGQVFDRKILEIVSRTLSQGPKRWHRRGTLSFVPPTSKAPPHASSSGESWGRDKVRLGVGQGD